jgi:uncharacterized phiE125 gp8 family phage protein
MMLIEETTVPGAALPVQALTEHLRLGTGFADDGLQDSLVESQLRAAIAVIEGRIGKALLTRRFRLELEDWRGVEQALPVAPVSAVLTLRLVDEAGSVVVGAERYRLVRDLHRPNLAGRGGALPVVPTDGRVEVVFEAGFGATWADVPRDLAQAVFLLAAEFHERRHESDGQAAGLPQGVQALIERWRSVRVLGGAGMGGARA